MCEWVVLGPVVAAFTYASMQMLTRKLGATDKASTMAFYIQMTFIAFSLVIGLGLGDGRFAGTGNPSLDFLFRAWRMPETSDIWLFIWCGVSAGFGGYLLSQAYRLGEAAIVAPFEYIAMPLAVAWGCIATSEDGRSWSRPTIGRRTTDASEPIGGVAPKRKNASRPQIWSNAGR